MSAYQVSCPGCKTPLRFPSAPVPGARFRCSKCEYIITVGTGAAPRPIAPAVPPAPPRVQAPNQPPALPRTPPAIPAIQKQPTAAPPLPAQPRPASKVQTVPPQPPVLNRPAAVTAQKVPLLPGRPGHKAPAPRSRGPLLGLIGGGVLASAAVAGVLVWTLSGKNVRQAAAETPAPTPPKPETK